MPEILVILVVLALKVTRVILGQLGHLCGVLSMVIFLLKKI